MKSIVIAGLILSLTGCTTSEQLAKNLSEKSVSGSGLIADNRIGVDENKIPTLKSVFISGDFKTIKADSNFIDYSEEISGSIFNAENKTKKTRLTITTKRYMPSEPHGEGDIAVELWKKLEPGEK